MGRAAAASLALALTHEFAPVRAEHADAALGALAACPQGARDDRPEHQLHGACSLRAAELRLALPFEAHARERLEADLRRVRARLN